MLPDHVINNMRFRVSCYFGTDDEDLMVSTDILNDAGFQFEEIRNILGGAFRSGYAQAEWDLS